MRGPYKIDMLYPSGSYDLQSIKSPTLVIIKKHGVDLYPCPQYIKPFPHVKSSDYQFGNIHKVITSNPYENASISKFHPAKPWEVLAAYADVTMESFPLLSQLDAKYDSWPESRNPFLHNKTTFTSGQNTQAPVLSNGYTKLGSSDLATPPLLQLLSTSTASRPFSQFVTDIIRSDGKLFFILHLPPNQSQLEWKLMQVNFMTTMKLHPKCLQDGKFLLQFYIQHCNDDPINLPDKRYWLEYHTQDNRKTLARYTVSPATTHLRVTGDSQSTQPSPVPGMDISHTRPAIAPWAL
jgi:hypothetical protein